VEVGKGHNVAEALAESALSPTTTNALIAMNATCPSDAQREGTGIQAFASILKAKSEAAAEGDMKQIEMTCAAQIVALNAIFADLAVRAQTNISAGYLTAGDSYMRLAFKAQAQCRATAETLGELKNPKPLYAKTYNVAGQINQAEGPQQINNAPQGRYPARKNEVSANKVLEA
jgi:hypothetical protein